MERVHISGGVSSVNITPPIGNCLSGSFKESRAVGVLDDLFVNAIVLNDGMKDVVFVSADIVFIPNHIRDDIFERIEQQAGIPKEHIILSVTHTHRGTMLEDSIGVWKHSPAYTESFMQKVVEAVSAATANKQTVRIGAGKAENRNHAFHRRLRKPDGSIVMSWAYDERRDADAVPGDAVDYEMTVLKVEDAEGNPLAFIVNYPTHNNAVGEPKFSADISGAMTRTLKRVYGDHLVVLFVQGASGDISCKDHRSADRHRPTKYLDIGKGLAGTVLQIDVVMEYPEITKVDVLSRKLLIRERPYCDYDTKEDGTFGTVEQGQVYFSVYRSVKESEGDSDKTNEINITVVKLGEHIAIVTNPGEIFAEIGLTIKAQSPFAYTFVFELTNGYEGYIPTQKAFLEGGYEVRKLASNSHLARNADEEIIRTSAELLGAQK